MQQQQILQQQQLMQKLAQSPTTDVFSKVKDENIKTGTVQCPEFSAAKQFITADEIAKFHDSITSNPNRDKISYKFYTTLKDIGSGRYVVALPINVAKDDETKSKMLTEIKKLMYDSKLSDHEKATLEYLHRSALREQLSKKI